MTNELEITGNGYVGFGVFPENVKEIFRLNDNGEFFGEGEKRLIVDKDKRERLIEFLKTEGYLR